MRHGGGDIRTAAPRGGAATRHGSTDEATWNTTLADASVPRPEVRRLGGAASPGIATYANTLATAETLNRLGMRSVQNGTGKIFVHNHQGEFPTTYVDPMTGQRMSAWETLAGTPTPGT